MVFSSVTFLFYFLPLSIIIYYLIPKKLRKIYLIGTSIAFYLYNNIYSTILLLFIILYNYSAVKTMNNQQNRYRKYKFIEIILVNIFLLCYFKYYFLILDILPIKYRYQKFLLPLGFSFYLFSILSYVIDNYQRKITKENNFQTFCLYILYFPKLLMGPIIRYNDFYYQLENIDHNNNLFHQGFKRFIIGMSMKLILADTFLKIINSFQVNSTLGSILLMFSYSFQLYFDFAGYTNMAIGISNILGINLEENFNYPYISKSISEFWRRWHITLGRWFRDYIYIPLGGNRVGKLKLIRNTIIVWILTGMWHGANINFIIWGIYFGILIIIKKVLLSKIKIPKLLSIPLTFLLVSIGWVIFFNNNLTEITNNLKYLITFSKIKDLEAIFILKNYYPYFIIAIIASTPLLKNIDTYLQNKSNSLYHLYSIIYLTALLLLSCAYLISSSYQPFLYSNF